jgi:hypothetical protein
MVNLKEKPIIDANLAKQKIQSLVIQLSITYIGLIYMTNQDVPFIREDINTFQYLMFVIMVSPQFIWLFFWGQTVLVNIMILAYRKDRGLFTLITCNLVDKKSFFKRHVSDNPEIHDSDDFDDIADHKDHEHGPEGHTEAVNIDEGSEPKADRQAPKFSDKEMAGLLESTKSKVNNIVKSI